MKGWKGFSACRRPRDELPHSGEHHLGRGWRGVQLVAHRRLPVTVKRGGVGQWVQRRTGGVWRHSPPLRPWLPVSSCRKAGKNHTGRLCNGSGQRCWPRTSSILPRSASRREQQKFGSMRTRTSSRGRNGWCVPYHQDIDRAAPLILRATSTFNRVPSAGSRWDQRGGRREEEGASAHGGPRGARGPDVHRQALQDGPRTGRGAYG